MRTRGEAAARAHEDRCQDPSLGKGAETQKSKFAKRTWNVPLNQLDRKMELRSEAVKPEFRSSMPGWFGNAAGCDCRFRLVLPGL